MFLLLACADPAPPCTAYTGWYSADVQNEDMRGTVRLSLGTREDSWTGWSVTAHVEQQDVVLEEPFPGATDWDYKSSSGSPAGVGCPDEDARLAGASFEMTQLDNLVDPSEDHRSNLGLELTVELEQYADSLNAVGVWNMSVADMVAGTDVEESWTIEFVLDER